MGGTLRFPWKKKMRPEELRQFDLRTGSSPGSSVESVGPPQITITFFHVFGWFHQVQKKLAIFFKILV